jgi:hypothetical protein
MNWAAYGRSAVSTGHSFSLDFLSLSVARLEKLQYPPLFYTCISFDFSDFRYILFFFRRASSALLFDYFDFDLFVGESAKERDKIYTMGSLLQLALDPFHFDL